MKVSTQVSAVLICLGAWSCVPGRRALPNQLREISGVAHLRRDTLLVLNDGGNPSVLHTLVGNTAVGADTLPFENVDFEAMASYHDGTICICDIGDNARRRDAVNFHFKSPDGRWRSVDRIYPTGARNAEACYVFMDRLFVITKAKAGFGGAPRDRLAMLLEVDTASAGSAVLQVRDSLRLRSRIVTDAVRLPATSDLAFVAYDYNRLLGFIPVTRTSVYRVQLRNTGGFRQNTLRERRIRAPLALTQYEAIAPTDHAEKVTIFSERTLWLPARRRRVRLPE